MQDRPPPLVLEPERFYYRVVEHNPPARADVISDFEAGKAKAHYESDEDHHGRSVYDRMADARDYARWRARRTSRPHFVIAIRVIQGGPLRAEQRGPDRHHFTLWGIPEEILASAQAVWP